MGAIYVYQHIVEQNMLTTKGYMLPDILELHDITLTIADDLYMGCIISKYAPIDTPEQWQWEQRYCFMQPAGVVKWGGVLLCGCLELIEEGY